MTLAQTLLHWRSALWKACRACPNKLKRKTFSSIEIGSCAFTCNLRNTWTVRLALAFSEASVSKP